MKNDIESKENRCTVMFKCAESDCTYNKTKDWCDYREIGNCNSIVAQISALTIRLQELTGKKVGLG